MGEVRKKLDQRQQARRDRQLRQGEHGRLNLPVEEAAPTFARFGYARCSTNKQELEYQVAEFEKRGITRDNIFQDFGESGKSFNRKQLQRMRSLARPGDVIEFLSINRMGRNQMESIRFIDDLEKHGINFCIYDMKMLDSADKALEHGIKIILISVLTYLAEKQLEQQREKSIQGSRYLRETYGMKPGKKPLDPDTVRQIRHLYDVEHLPKLRIAKILNRSLTAVRHYIADRDYAPTPPITAAQAKLGGFKQCSPAKLEANRKNGAKSSGPRSNVSDKPTVMIEVDPEPEYAF
jgi:DNA invertase Pin-like site-specific DNA recombinase